MNNLFKKNSELPTNVIEKVKDPNWATNVGKNEGIIKTPTLEGGVEMYTVLIDGGEMGVAKKEAIELAKETFDQLYSNNKEEIDALNGKKAEEVLDGLKKLMN
jgi:hypothetical protein